MAEKHSKDFYWSRARWIASQYKDGRTLRSIGDEAGISERRVSQIIKSQTGLETRPRGGYHPKTSLKTEEKNCKTPSRSV